MKMLLQNNLQDYLKKQDMKDNNFLFDASALYNLLTVYRNYTDKIDYSYSYAYIKIDNYTYVKIDHNHIYILITVYGNSTDKIDFNYIYVLDFNYIYILDHIFHERKITNFTKTSEGIYEILKDFALLHYITF